MRVLVACEYSGRVRNAFINAGHDAMSCDLLPSEQPDPFGNDDCHHQGDVLQLLSDQSYKFDLMIAHPPCTYLSVAGARWMKTDPTRQDKQDDAIGFVRILMSCNIPRICIENPISVISTKIRKPDQIINPWEYGHGETKKTCLWLKNLPKLVPTNIVEGREAKVHRMPPGPNRWKDRSRTYQGIANAFALQWGNL